jgi:hypothetical protein
MSSYMYLITIAVQPEISFQQKCILYFGSYEKATVKKDIHAKIYLYTPTTTA